MKNLPKFVIHLDRLNRDVSKVAFLLEKYEEDRKRARMEIAGKSIPLQVQYLRAFSGNLIDEITKAATSQGADPFENEFEGIQKYQYIEMTIDPSYQIFSVRLLGDVSKPIDRQKRYTIFCADNTIDPTTINIISNIRNISDGEAEDLLKTNQDPKSKGTPAIKNVPGRGGLIRKGCSDKEVEPPVGDAPPAPGAGEASPAPGEEGAIAASPASGEELTGPPPPPPGEEQGSSVEDCFITNKPKQEPLPNPQAASDTPPTPGEEPVGDAPPAPGEEPVGDAPPAPGEEEVQTEIVWVEKELTEDELTLKKQRIKYNTTAREIAAKNGIAWSTKAINKWVLEVGGKMLSSGYAVFQPGNKILLPQEKPLETTKSSQTAAPALPANVRATWTEFVKTYFFPSPQIIPSSKPFSAEDSARASQKYDAKPEKTKKELEKENRETKTTSFKLGVKAGTRSGVQQTDSGSDIFSSKEAFISGVNALTGDPVELLFKCYDEIAHKYDLGVLIENAIKCLTPNLTCREILSGLTVETLEEKISFVFANQPKIGNLVKSRISALKASTPEGVLVTADMLLEELQDCIDFEAICNLDFSGFRRPESGDSNFPPTMNMPQLPIVDLYASISVEIENAILESLIQSIKSLIIGVLEDLSSCSTLDALVAGALQGNLAPEAGGINAAAAAAGAAATGALDAANKIKDLFEAGFEAANAVGEAVEGVGKTAEALGRSWEEFSSETKRVLQEGCNQKQVAVQAAIDNITNVQELVESLGGIPGLAEKIVNEEINKIDALKTIDTMLSTQITNMDLLDEIFGERPEGTETLSEALEEVGKYSIASDLESFTLQTIGEDQVKVIAETTSIVACPAKISVGLDIAGPSITADNLLDTLGSALDDIISILSPGEFLEVLAGLPSNRVVKIIQEIMNTRYPEFDCGDPVSLVVRLGELSGLKELKDQLIILSQNNPNSLSEVPRKYCAEDDVRLELRRQLLTPSGLTPEEKDREIERIVNERVRRYNELSDLLAKGGNITPDEILDNISCGTGVNPSGLRPKVIEDQINASFNMMFDMAKSVFDREVKKLTDAVSSQEMTTKGIPRKIQGLTGGLADSILGSPGIGGGSSAQAPGGEHMNPEFLKLLLGGFIPDFQDLVSNPLLIPPAILGLGLPEIDPDAGPTEIFEGLGDSITTAGPFTNGGDISVPDIKTKVAGLFLDGMKVSSDNIQVTGLDNEMSISLKGSLPILDPANQYLGEAVPAASKKDPKWNFRYFEDGENYTLKINSVGAIPSKLYGKIPFFENYKFKGNYTNELDPDIKNMIDGLNQDPTQSSNRRSTFASLLGQKTKMALNDETDLPEIVEFFRGRYPEALSRLLSSNINNFKNNRLLQKVPETDFSLPAFEEKQEIPEQEQIILSLINFSPEQTPQQRRCKIDPHLLDLQSIKQKVKEQFEKECEDPQQPNDGFTPSRKPINSAGFVGLVLTFIRLYAIEYVFRSIFVLDEYKYSTGIAQDPLMVDYVSSRIKEDLTRLGVWNKFEYELDIAFDKLVEQNAIKPLETDTLDDGSTMVSDTQGLGENENSAAFSNGLPQKLKALTRETMISVYKRVSALVGNKSEEKSAPEYPYELDFLKSLPIEYVLRNFTAVQNVEAAFNSFSSGIERKPLRVERYVRYKNKDGVTVVNDLGGFLDDVFDEALINPESGTAFSLSEYPTECYYGIRVSYVEEADSTVYNSLKETISGAVSRREKAYLQRQTFVDADTDAASINIFGAPPNDITLSDSARSIKYINIPIACEESFFLTEDIISLVGGTELSEQPALTEMIDMKEPELFERLSGNLDFRTFLNYCLPFSRLRTMMSIYSTYVLNGEDMKFLLEGTKLELVRLFSVLQNVGNYSVRPDLAAAENLNQYKQDFENTGNPAGPRGPDALYLASITPLRIYKGITELVDPNCFITSKIVTAAAEGYLSPKLERVSGQIKVGRFDKAGTFLGYAKQFDVDNTDGSEEVDLTIDVGDESIAQGNIYLYDDLGNLVIPDWKIRRVETTNENGEDVVIPEFDAELSPGDSISVLLADDVELIVGPLPPGPIIRNTPVYEIDWVATIIAGFNKALERGVNTSVEERDDIIEQILAAGEDLPEPQDFLNSALEIVGSIGFNPLEDIQLRNIPAEDDLGRARSDAGQLVIRRGGIGLPVPGGETNALVGGLQSVFQGAVDALNQAGSAAQQVGGIAGQAAGIAQQAGLDEVAGAAETTGAVVEALVPDIDINFDLIPSTPVYPGEPVNLPYPLVSMLLRPFNIFFSQGGPMGPPITRLGMYLLALDPFINQLPYFQAKFARSGAGDAIKKQTGVDLSAGSNFVCPDVDNN